MLVDIFMRRRVSVEIIERFRDAFQVRLSMREQDGLVFHCHWLVPCELDVSLFAQLRDRPRDACRSFGMPIGFVTRATFISDQVHDRIMLLVRQKLKTVLRSRSLGSPL